MNKCLNCGKDVKNKYCNVSCQNKHQNPGRVDKKYGKIKLFTVVCDKCGDNFDIEEREKLYPEKEKYFCSRSCANSRTLSNETKNKIQSTLKEYNKDKWGVTICKQCGNDIHHLKSRKRIFCSRSCSTQYRNLHGLGSKAGKVSVIKSKKTPISKTFIYALEYPKECVKYIGKSNTPKKRF